MDWGGGRKKVGGRTGSTEGRRNCGLNVKYINKYQKYSIKQIVVIFQNIYCFLVLEVGP